MRNGRCRLHGGKTPSGLASPLTKTGRYSRDMPTRLLARYEQAQHDPELLSVKHDVALLQSVVEDRLAAWAAAQAGPDWGAVLDRVETITGNWRTWDFTRMERELRALAEAVGERQSEATILAEIRDLMDQRAKLAQQEHKRMLDLDQVLTVEEAIVLAQTIAAIVQKYLPDLETRRAINAEFTKAFEARGGRC